MALQRGGFLVAGQVELCLLEQALVVLQGAFGLLELGFVGPGIDFDQRLAFADHLSFAIVDRDDLTRDLAVEADRRDGRDGAQGVDVDADVALADSGGLDSDDGGLIECTLVRFGLGLVGNQQHHDENKQGDQDDAKPGAAFFHGDGSTGEGSGDKLASGLSICFWTPGDGVVCCVALPVL